MFVIQFSANHCLYITILKNLLSVKLLSCKTQGQPINVSVYILGRLSLRWKSWPSLRPSSCLNSNGHGSVSLITEVVKPLVV
jgi:hypothetical protein